MFVCFIKKGDEIDNKYPSSRDETLPVSTKTCVTGQITHNKNIL